MLTCLHEVEPSDVVVVVDLPLLCVAVEGSDNPVSLEKPCQASLPPDQQGRHSLGRQPEVQYSVGTVRSTQSTKCCHPILPNYFLNVVSGDPEVVGFSKYELTPADHLSVDKFYHICSQTSLYVMYFAM